MEKKKAIRRRVIEDASVLRPAWERVGRYLYYLAHLELALGDLLHHSLNLSDESAGLLLPRVMFTAKLDVIHQMIPGLEQPEDWKENAKRIVTECRRFIDERNMFAHGAFTPNVDGTTLFHYISMKGKEIDPRSWPAELFDQKCKELERLEREVCDLYPGFRPKDYIMRPGSA